MQTLGIETLEILIKGSAPFSAAVGVDGGYCHSADTLSVGRGHSASRLVALLALAVIHIRALKMEGRSAFVEEDNRFKRPLDSGIEASISGSFVRTILKA